MRFNKLFTFVSFIFLSSSFYSCGNKSLKINEIISPVETYNNAVKKFLSNPVDENIASYGKNELSKPNPIHLSWSGGVGDYKVTISENADMSNPYIISTKNKYCDLFNIKLKTKYYYTVEDCKEKTNISTFISKEDKFRLIDIDGVTNCRDLGLYKTSNGKEIKQGIIYRTARFNKSHSSTLIKEITSEGEDTLKNQLGIKTEIDLRETDKASGQAYNGYIPGVEYKTYRMNWEDVDNLLLENKDNIKKLFDEVLSNENSYPLAFHCSQGSDRAGCIAYTILAICGVEEKDLIADYLLSNYGLTAYERKFSKIKNSYPLTLNSGEGSSLMERAANSLVNNCNISLETINKIRNILVK